MLNPDSTRTTEPPARAEPPLVEVAEHMPRTPRSTATPFGGLAAGDWNDMHDAVAERLQTILESTAPGIALAESKALADRTHALALDCAAALNQLRAAVAIDRADQHRLERELSDARAALARSQSDFEDSQAGELHARHLALHDELTKLPNRRHCRERLDEALALAAARRTTAALMFLDLDGFKEINDRHGHEVGDEVLRIVAARLTRAVRAEDIVCRLGGDEFVCLPSGPLGGPQLAHLASKLFDAVSAPLALKNLHLKVQPSIGVAIFPIHADNTEALLNAADAAMYRAKLHHIGFAFAERVAGVEMPLR
jgi:diguanylate cyclase (GGDEF)-like protein